MSTKKFADAMGSAAGGGSNLFDLAGLVKKASLPKPQPQHVETRRLGSAI